MSRLEDIPKKPFFRVPEGFFDKLPSDIQARLETAPRQVRQPLVRYALVYVLPLLIAAAVIFYNIRQAKPVESILASVETTDLIQYLEDSEITTDEMLLEVDLNADELETIESAVYGLYVDETDPSFINSEF